MPSGQKKNLKNNSRASLGSAGETFVALTLQSKGYKILDCNYRRRFGEVDIIAQIADTIIFVEVKCRVKKYFNLSEVVNRTKQRKIILAAKSYIVQKKVYDKVLRFDVALVEKNGTKYNLNYIENAFTEECL